ncbi:MAG: glycosyltransferase [Nibricoccus sp.]
MISVGTDATQFSDCEPGVREVPVLQCLYSGHMGRLHDWETLGAALRPGVPQGVNITIASDGPSANALKSHLQNTCHERLSFSGTRQSVDWKATMLGADVALVTMLPGAEKVVMPSKTYSAMAAGQAVLAICPDQSDLADLIKTHDCGWVIEPGDARNLRTLLEGLPQRSAEVHKKRINSYNAAHAHYSMESTSRQWLKLFGELNEHSS